MISFELNFAQTEGINVKVGSEQDKTCFGLLPYLVVELLSCLVGSHR